MSGKIQTRAISLGTRARSVLISGCLQLSTFLKVHISLSFSFFIALSVFQLHPSRERRQVRKLPYIFVSKEPGKKKRPTSKVRGDESNSQRVRSRCPAVPKAPQIFPRSLRRKNKDKTKHCSRFSPRLLQALLSFRPRPADVQYEKEE